MSEDKEDELITGSKIIGTWFGTEDEYENWLKTQTPEYQISFLGEDGYMLFKMGIPLYEIEDENNKGLSANEILKKPRSPFGDTEL